MENKIAIVTGANSGFGKEFVKLLSKDKSLVEIWAIARNEENLQKLKEEYGEKISILSMDLTDRRNFNAIKELLEKKAVVIKYLVNSAGYAKFCSYYDIGIDESLNMIDLNVNAVVAMGLICLPYMKKGSHIINIASQASFQPLPYLNVYGSTKSFVRNYTRALNVELEERGICATAVCPGWMKTKLFERGDIGAAKAANNFVGMVTPDVVAKKALSDADKGKDQSVYGVYVNFAHIIAKLLPQKLMMKIWLMQQRM
ncbi:MAG: SDR family NAD(P)-dependent oxidoreductase [Clostridium sp.]|nr:SDR family NAD(P)-dependent oxidoreductase [Clostridium sp.]